MSKNQIALDLLSKVFKVLFGKPLPKSGTFSFTLHDNKIIKYQPPVVFIDE